ncbi:MAG: T9SS type A sorting domain-containing protein, partial [Ignavibacteria bacterium]|nr:T9SS type A sorting domain-containing protein [Ignavibacteria bacterium]
VNGKYVYAAEKGDGLTVYSNDLITSVDDDNLYIPESITLHQNYPNPFNPTTNILIELKEKTFVSLEVFNSIGQRVAVLLNNQLSAGSTNVSFDASSLSTGVYLYRLNANGITSGKKMMLIK